MTAREYLSARESVMDAIVSVDPGVSDPDLYARPGRIFTVPGIDSGVVPIATGASSQPPLNGRQPMDPSKIPPLSELVADAEHDDAGGRALLFVEKAGAGKQQNANRVDGGRGPETEMQPSEYDRIREQILLEQQRAMQTNNIRQQILYQGATATARMGIPW